MKGYIYKITNKTNNKNYIGQTSRSINERFGEHLRDAYNRNSEQPIYRAIRKYGKENFSVELLEECNIADIDEREIYYINKYDTYNNGYNATLGGEGKPVVNYKELAEDFLNSNKSIRQYAKDNKKKETTIRNALNSSGLMEEYKEKHPEYNNRDNAISVTMIDKKTNDVINTFESINSAIKFLGKEKDKGHIKAVCTGKRKTAYGYIWKYA